MNIKGGNIIFHASRLPKNYSWNIWDQYEIYNVIYEWYDILMWKNSPKDIISYTHIYIYIVKIFSMNKPVIF